MDDPARPMGVIRRRLDTGARTLAAGWEEIAETSAA